MATAFISYGSPDELFASELNTVLRKAGIKTFFFPLDAKPGDKLHHVMRNGVNSFDRVIFICSKNSLTRRGVINELEETLQREAREGGQEILIPISIDNYIFDDWNPTKSGLKLTLLDRVIGDFRDVHVNKKKIEKACSKLIEILKDDSEIEYIKFHTALNLDIVGEKCRVLLVRSFIAKKPIIEILYTNLTSSGEIIPLSSSIGHISATETGGNKTIVVKLDEALPVNEVFEHKLEIEHLNAYTKNNESYSFTVLHACQYSSIDIVFPSKRLVKEATFECVFKNQVMTLPDNISIALKRDKVNVWVRHPIIGANYVVRWLW